LNYLTPQTREEILNILLNGLKRLEYRGYDSAGYYSTLLIQSSLVWLLDYEDAVNMVYI